MRFPSMWYVQPTNPAHTRSLIRAFASRLSSPMIVKLLTEHHLEFLG